MRKSPTHFERIPVQKVKELVATSEGQVIPSLAAESFRHALSCQICRKPVPAETAKTDGYGKAVQEECYILALTQKPAASGTRRTHFTRSSNDL